MNSPQLLIEGYLFKQGSFACPEQYDVFDLEGTLCAYVRLRHSQVKVYCPDFGGHIVYEAETIGDGAFLSSERLKHLKAAVIGIQEWIISKQYDEILE